MAKDKHKIKGKVYRPFLFWRIRATIIIVIFLLIEYVILAITHVPMFIVLFICFNLLATPILWFAYGEGWRSKLIVTEDGITFVHFCGEIFTDWDNLRLKRSFWQEHNLILEFNEPPQDTTQNRVLRWLKLMPNHISLEAYVSYFPVFTYLYDIRKTELGRDLMHYAPHLFDDEKSKREDDSAHVDVDDSAHFHQQGEDSKHRTHSVRND